MDVAGVKNFEKSQLVSRQLGKELKSGFGLLSRHRWFALYWSGLFGSFVALRHPGRMKKDEKIDSQRAK